MTYTSVCYVPMRIIGSYALRAKGLVMKIVMRFSELDAAQNINKAVVRLINKLDADLASRILDIFDAEGDPLGEFEIIAQEFPGFVKINAADEAVVITIPPEVMNSMMKESESLIHIFGDIIVGIGSLLRSFLPMMKRSSERTDTVINDFLKSCRK